jgi:hypothetical protein
MRLLMITYSRWSQVLGVWELENDNIKYLGGPTLRMPYRCVIVDRQWDCLPDERPDFWLPLTKEYLDCEPDKK